jgi:N-methylhydantoinase A
MAGGRVGVDVGGTFTDLVFLSHDGQIQTAKVPSTPSDQSEAVMRSLDAAAVGPECVAFFAHGTTVTTNALLERRGGRTALVTTEGFRDLLEIGRQNRPSLYDLTVDRPPSLVPRELRITVKERMGPLGMLEPLDPESLDAAVQTLRAADIEAVAVCLLFGFLHPEHERRVGEAIQQALSDVHVSLSSEVLPEFREFERLSTTAANAYLEPVLAAYLETLAAKAREHGIPAPLVMQSSGGVLDIDAARTTAAACVLSGPAGGVVGAAHVAGLSGFTHLLTFDMGGTSTDVAPIVEGDIQTTTDAAVAGVTIRFPMVDVHSVSAGGGSIAWVDKGSGLRVGPRSAGAEPGPAAYGRGGQDATVTDADLVLGYLPDRARLGGEVVLRSDLAEKAIQRIADLLGTGIPEAAQGVIDVANAEVARALRLVSVQRGLDPREFVLVAFGGAGPMHACALAEELGMRNVLVPRESGVLSALGLAISDLRRDYVSPSIVALEDLDPNVLAGTFDRMKARAERDLPSPSFRTQADLRYQGQSFELTVDTGIGVGGLAKAFHRAHHQRYGYRMDDQPVQMVNARLVATVPGTVPEPTADEPARATELSARAAWFDGRQQEIPIHHRTRMGSGSSVEGPAVVEFPEATCVVRPGWRGKVDGAGNLILDRS